MRRYVLPCPSFLSLLSTDCLECEQTSRGSKHTIPNSNVGKESISQTISALEHWRFNHANFYQDIPDVKERLRDDSCIKTIETAKKHDEPK